MSNVSLERYYFVLYDGALTLKMSKMALNAFCDKTLHVDLYYWQLPYNFMPEKSEKVHFICCTKYTSKVQNLDALH